MAYITNDFLKNYCPFETVDINFLVDLMNKFDVNFHEIDEYVTEYKNDAPANIYDINVYIESCYKVMIDNVYRWVDNEVDVNEDGDEYANDRLLSYIDSSKDEIGAYFLASNFDNIVVNELFKLSKETSKFPGERLNEQVRGIMATYM